MARRRRARLSGTHSAFRVSPTSRLTVLALVSILILATWIASVGTLDRSSPSASPSATNELSQQRLYSLLAAFPANTQFPVFVFKNMSGDLCELPNASVKVYEENNIYANGTLNLSLSHALPFTVSFKLAALQPNQTEGFASMLNSTDGLCSPFLASIAANSTYVQNTVNFSGVLGYGNSFSNFTQAGWKLIGPPGSQMMEATRYTSFVIYRNTAISVVMWAFNDMAGRQQFLIDYTDQLVEAVKAAYAGS